MSLIKRVKGDYLIESVSGSNNVIIKSQNITLEGLDRYVLEPDDDGFVNFANTVTIKGNLVVIGETTTVSSANMTITDNTLILNAGETGPGITLGEAGFEIDRGDGITAGEETVGLRYKEGGGWEANDSDINNAGAWYPLNPGLAAFALINDTSPTLGGTLDVSTFAITTTVVNGNVELTATTGGDILLSASDTGNISLVASTGVEIDPVLVLRELDENTEVPGITIESGKIKIYAAPPGDGKSGIYVKSTSTEDELITRRKALLYSIIF